MAGDVNGSMSIGISNTGNWSVNGHAHNSGFFGMNYTMGFTFTDDINGRVFGAVRSGVVHGTLDAESRDDDFVLGGKDITFLATDVNLVPNWETFAQSPVHCSLHSSANAWLVAEAALTALGLVPVGLVVIVLATMGGGDNCHWDQTTGEYICEW